MNQTEHVRIRARGKQADQSADKSNPPSSNGRNDQGNPGQGEESACPEQEGARGADREREAARSKEDPTGSDGQVGDDSRQVSGNDLFGDQEGRRLPLLREVSKRDASPPRSPTPTAPDLCTSSPRGRASSADDYGKGKRDDGRFDELGREQCDRDGPKSRRERSEHGENATAGTTSAHKEDRTSSGVRDSDAAGTDPATEDGSRRTLRSRSPVSQRRVSFNDDVQFEPAEPILKVGDTDVISISMAVAPRDMHQVRKGTKSYWEINRKPKQNAEVRFDKLTEEEQVKFTEAKHKEIDSFLKNEAIRICSMHGVERERVMQMRWILTWKRETDKDGQVVGQKPKARLIMKGYQDPDLTQLDRDAPTLSVLFRNLLLAQTAARKFRLAVGDIKTAFLQGDDTEEARRVFADPPTDVKEHLHMKETELFRLKKAIYGLLNAPKRWFEKLSRTLIGLGWIQHQLDKCMFMLYDDDDPQKLVGMCGMHVDDLLCSGSGSKYENCVQQLRSVFPFGSWSFADEEVVTFCGCELFQDQEKHIYLGQEKFYQSI